MNNPTKTVLLAVGVILLLGAIVKFSIIGVYTSEVPLYLAILFAGAVCVYASEKMKKHDDEDDEPDDGNNDIVG
jgi:uncharacterized membrane protein YiaA